MVGEFELGGGVIEDFGMLLLMPAHSTQYVKLQSLQSLGDTNNSVIQAKLLLLSNDYSRVLAAYHIT